MRSARQGKTSGCATDIDGHEDEYVLTAASVGLGDITWWENVVLPPPSTYPWW